ncbi:hypothetical protein LWI29_015166 [Acer saccharum]|uniref:Uncharacterized protein n=1 Tax=Acer saccharum TaxID=4024 RepID=A0AA39VZK2_ACESA|nr:hypothetical protein LWI29_015166 [Acer saccharum]
MLPSSSPVLSHSVFPSSAIFIAQQITIQLRRSWSVESRFFFVVVRRSSASLQSLVSSLHSPVTILHSLQIAADPRVVMVDVEFLERERNEFLRTETSIAYENES